MSSGIKLTYEEVKECFANHGCELLEETYKNARTKMRYRCKCGNESEIVFDSFKRGNRCRGCGNRKSRKKQTLSHKQAAKKFEDLGCELLEEYKKSSAKVKFRCHCGRVSEGLPNNIWRRGRCNLCGLEARSGENHYDWVEDRDQFELDYAFRQRSYKLIQMVLNVTGRVKNKRTAKLLGYDYKQLQDRITLHPSWSKVKKFLWQVDHVFPIKSFLDYGISDLQIINGLDNLRPMTAEGNSKKNASYNSDDFEFWLKEKGVRYVPPDDGF